MLKLVKKKHEQIKSIFEAENFFFFFKKMKYRFIFLLKVYLQKHDLNTVKVDYCDMIGCSIRVCNFIILKSSIKILYILLEPSVCEVSPTSNEISPILKARSNFHR